MVASCKTNNTVFVAGKHEAESDVDVFDSCRVAVPYVIHYTRQLILH